MYLSKFLSGVEVQLLSLWQLIVVASLCFTVSVAVAVISARKSIISLFEARKAEVQAVHKVATPRLGSIGLLVAYGCAGMLFVSEPLPLFALLPVVFVALAEDLGVGIPPLGRLVAVAVAASLQLLLFGFWIDRVDVAFFDQTLAHWLVGGAMTVFVVTAVSHSFNLVDGLNGLAAVCALAGSAGMGLIAQSAGLEGESFLAAIVFMCVVGFLPLNFPKAYLFLGDTGAYTLGFLLSCLGIMLIAGSTEVSPWAVLLCVFWPIVDTSWSIVRRIRKGVPVSSPDREHMHHLAFDFVCFAFAGRRVAKYANPLSTFCMIPFIVTPPILGVLLWDKSQLALLSIAVLVMSYMLTYLATRRFLSDVADEFSVQHRPAE